MFLKQLIEIKSNDKYSFFFKSVKILNEDKNAEEIILYKINKGTNNDENFLQFLKEVLIVIKN